jgi:hypothetical protein
MLSPARTHRNPGVITWVRPILEQSLQIMQADMASFNLVPVGDSFDYDLTASRWTNLDAIFIFGITKQMITGRLRGNR